MSDSTTRVGPFWDAIEGRTPLPPVANLLGWRLEEIDPDAGTIVVGYEAKPEFANPMGKVQGGIVAAMLDDTMGPALVATLPPGKFAPTIEMKVSFLEPAAIGRRLFGHGRVVKVGGTIAFLEGDLRDERNTLLATATATARLVDVRQPHQPLVSAGDVTRAAERRPEHTRMGENFGGRR